MATLLIKQRFDCKSWRRQRDLGQRNTSAAEKALGVPIPYSETERRSGDPPVVIASSSLAKETWVGKPNIRTGKPS